MAVELGSLLDSGGARNLLNPRNIVSILRHTASPKPIAGMKELISRQDSAAPVGTLRGHKRVKGE